MEPEHHEVCNPICKKFSLDWKSTIVPTTVYNLKVLPPYCPESNISYDSFNAALRKSLNVVARESFNLLKMRYLLSS
jgi:hypothetical protein